MFCPWKIGNRLFVVQIHSTPADSPALGSSLPLLEDPPCDLLLLLVRLLCLHFVFNLQQKSEVSRELPTCQAGSACAARGRAERSREPPREVGLPPEAVFFLPRLEQKRWRL